MASSPITSWQINGKTMETVTNFIFLGSKITSECDCSLDIKRCLPLGSKAMINLDRILQRHYFADKGLSSQIYGFSGSHVWMWELDYKESWVLKNWCFWTVMLEKTLESPLDCKRSYQSILKGIKLEYSLRRTAAEAETGILWPPDAKSWLIGKDPDAGEIESKRRKGQ